MRLEARLHADAGSEAGHDVRAARTRSTRTHSGGRVRVLRGQQRGPVRDALYQEFGELALLGTTIMALSGYTGVRGDNNDCYKGTEYVASYPASAAYGTAVDIVEDGDFDALNTDETA